MHLDQYQREIREDLIEDGMSILDQAKMLARALRFITHMGQILGYSLEELASLDREQP